MAQGRIDIGEVVRRALPPWTVWVLYAVPVAWILVVVAHAMVADYVYAPDRGSYDEDGNPVSSPDEPGSSLLPRLGLVLGIQGTGMDTRALIALIFALVLVIVHAPGIRPSVLRAMGTAGAALAGVEVLAVVGTVGLRDQVEQEFGFIQTSGRVFNGLPPLLYAVPAAVLAWLFIRFTWWPLPLVAEGRAGADTSEPEVEPDAASSPAAPTPAALPSERGGEEATLPDELDARGWDLRAEPPVDFVPPPPGQSVFERPSPTASATTARESMPPADPMAAYRRPPDTP